MSVGNKKVSSVDWCLLSSIAGLVTPSGKFSMPVTRTWMPSKTRAPPIAQPSQRTAIHHKGVPRMRNDAATMIMPHGTTVTSIQSI